MTLFLGALSVIYYLFDLCLFTCLIIYSFSGSDLTRMLDFLFQNVELLKQFLSPYTGQVESYTKTGKLFVRLVNTVRYSVKWCKMSVAIL